MMSFTESVKTCFRKTFSYSGRATRAEYWWFQLFIWVVSAAIVGIACVARDVSGLMYTIAGIFCFVTLFPNIAVCVRRLHDGGHSAMIWFFFCIGLPGMLIGWVLDLITPDSAMPPVGDGFWNLLGLILGMVVVRLIPGLLIGLPIINIINMLKSGADNEYGPNPFNSVKESENVDLS